ncbi:MAG: type IV pilus assembly protein PilM [bacterium]
MFFSTDTKNYIGIDIGTTSIKIVEFSKKRNEKIKLESYGSGDFSAFPKNTENVLQNAVSRVSDGQAADIIKRILKESGIKSKKVIMSAPVFSTFTSVIELPEMSEKEIESAINFEAKQYVPVPLTEVVLGWSVIGKKTYDSVGNGGSFNKILVLIVAIPRELANSFSTISDLAGLNLVALETESFALIRSLLGNDKSTVAVVDIGSRATNITIVSGGFIRVSRGIETSGSEITKVLMKSMGVDYQRANELKKKIGLKEEGGNMQISSVLTLIIDIITGETKRIIDVFARKETQSGKIERIILVGGSAMIPGLAERFSEVSGVKTVVGNPWSRVEYPQELEKTLEFIGPSFSVAVGLAMRELNN